MIFVLTINRKKNNMLIFKFGGASVNSAAAVKNLTNVIKPYTDKLVIVISAMGKMTNAFEELLQEYFNKGDKIQFHADKIRDFHFDIIKGLFDNSRHIIFSEIDTVFNDLQKKLSQQPSENYDYEYDRIVHYGELLSTKITSIYLNENGIANKWTDIRECLKTDSTYREAKVDWSKTAGLMNDTFTFKNERIYITQGFIGSTHDDNTTTLGREGSDFTASVIAYCLNGESVTIWKDVPGVLNADPKWFDNTVQLNNISYLEAVELAYYGATIIHPKTIKPLQNKDIPLFVKSFVSHTERGTVIDSNISEDSLIPSFIFRMNQVLISISARDYSFIMEDNLSQIFGIFADHGIKINMMQNSAISFSVSVDHDKRKLPDLIDELRTCYRVLYNANLELVTIRHYDQATIDRVIENKRILVEQKSRNTARFVMQDLI